MPSLEKPCLLVPHGSERSTAYICIPVDPDLAMRSSVLETLLEFEGFVDLPEGITLDDFETWAEVSTQDPSTLSLNQLALAMQVWPV